MTRPKRPPEGLRFAEYTAKEAEDDDALIDALRRYKAVNNTVDFDMAKAEPFLQALWGLDPLVEPHITLYEDAVKVRLKFKDKEFVIDYNFEESETVFILSKQEGKLFVKDCALSDMEKTLGLF